MHNAGNEVRPDNRWNWVYTAGVDRKEETEALLDKVSKELQENKDRRDKVSQLLGELGSKMKEYGMEEPAMNILLRGMKSYCTVTHIRYAEIVKAIFKKDVLPQTQSGPLDKWVGPGAALIKPEQTQPARKCGGRQ